MAIGSGCALCMLTSVSLLLGSHHPLHFHYCQYLHLQPLLAQLRLLRCFIVDGAANDQKKWDRTIIGGPNSKRKPTDPSAADGNHFYPASGSPAAAQFPTRFPKNPTMAVAAAEPPPRFSALHSPRAESLGSPALTPSPHEFHPIVVGGVATCTSLGCQLCVPLVPPRLFHPIASLKSANDGAIDWKLRIQRRESQRYIRRSTIRSLAEHQRIMEGLGQLHLTKYCKAKFICYINI